MTSGRARPERRRQRPRFRGLAIPVAVMMIVSSCATDGEPPGYLPAVGAPPLPVVVGGVGAEKDDAVIAAPLILDEEFHGSALDTVVWNTCHWWDDGGCTIASNDELEWYLPEQVRVEDGGLMLTAERRDVTGADGTTFPYASGMVTTGPSVHDGEPKLAFTYGTVDVGFRAPRGAGLWPAIWMLPASEESKPEIDLFEAVGQRTQQANMYFHPARSSAMRTSHRAVLLPEGEDLTTTHTVRLEWSPRRLNFFFDGEKVWEVTGDHVPDEPMYLVLNLAVGGAYGGPPDPAAFPATFQVDYARIWSAGRA